MRDEILKFVGEIVAYGGGSAVIAYGAFLFFGKGWIENRFKERLEAFRHSQARDLEELKGDIRRQLDRHSLLQEKEFEVLPECWARLLEVKGPLMSLVSLLRSIPDVNRMSPAQVEEFLASSKLYEYEKDELREVEDKTKRYDEMIFHHKLSEVKSIYREFHLYFEKNKIFISEYIKEKLTAADDLMWDALTEHELGKEMDDVKVQVEAARKLRGSFEPIAREIEKVIHHKLHDLSGSEGADIEESI